MIKLYYLKYLIVICLTAIFLVNACNSQQPSVTDTGAGSQNAEVAPRVKDVLLKSENKNLMVTSGNQVTLKLFILNSSDLTLRFVDDLTITRGLKVLVQDEKGKEVSRTNNGQMFILPTAPLTVLGSKSSYEVKSGKRLEFVINLSTVFDLTLPGKYSIRVSTTVGMPNKQDVDFVKLTAETIHVDIKERPMITINQN